MKTPSEKLTIKVYDEEHDRATDEGVSIQMRRSVALCNAAVRVGLPESRVWDILERRYVRSD